MNNPTPGKYQHYKGNFYELIGVARHSETLEKMRHREISNGAHYNTPVNTTSLLCPYQESR